MSEAPPDATLAVWEEALRAGLGEPADTEEALDHLTATFGLDAAARAALVVLAARAFGLAPADGPLVELLCRFGLPRREVVAALRPSSPLRRGGLVEEREGALHLHAAVGDHLCGVVDPERGGGAARLERTAPIPAEAAWQAELEAMWSARLHGFADAEVVFLAAAQPDARQAALRALFLPSKAWWLTVDCARLGADLTWLERDLRLLSVPVVLDTTRTPPPDPAKEEAGRRAPDLEPMWTAVETALRVRTQVLVLADRPLFPFDNEGLRSRRMVQVPVPPPSADARSAACAVIADAWPLDDAGLEWLQREGPATPARLHDLVSSARALQPTGAIGLGAFVRAIDLRAGAQLGAHVRRVDCRYDFEDLVIPPHTRRALLEIIAAHHHRARVLDAWGFGHKHVRHRGVAALMFGSPGTGKTMAAEVISGAIGRPLYRVNLGSVVSKYIGETERNLEKVFGEAEQTEAVLLFDEADALFGRRTQIKDSHDRYANVQVDYLLQRIESYEGVVLLTTNLVQNIDQGFVRRLLFRVPFPDPGVAERREIWRRAFPPAAEVVELDIEFLAQRFPITGGHIRNAALIAAIHASAAGEIIGMRHALAGVRREIEKLGRPFRPADLTPYHEVAELS